MEKHSALILYYIFVILYLLRPVKTYSVNLTFSSYGTIYIHNGVEWGTVCDDNFDINDANVVCRQLGYSGATSAVNSWDVGTGPIFLDNLECLGDESYIWDCPHNGWEIHNCFHREDAGVTCDTNVCSSSPCVYGSCTDYENYYACSCNAGYTGTNCDDTIWEESTTDVTTAVTVMTMITVTDFSAEYDTMVFGTTMGIDLDTTMRPTTVTLGETTVDPTQGVTTAGPTQADTSAGLTQDDDDTTVGHTQGDSTATGHTHGATADPPTHGYTTAQGDTTGGITQSDIIAAGPTQGDTVGLTTEVRTITTIAESDLQVTGLMVTNPTSNLNFYPGTDTIVTYNITIINSGGTDIEAADYGDNWSFEISLSDTANPTTANVALTFTVSTSSALNTGAELIAGGGSAVVSGVESMITVTSDDENCYRYLYTCVVISRADSVNYTDAVSTNNHNCVELGDVSEGYSGDLPCIGCVTRISLVLLSLAWLLNHSI